MSDVSERIGALSPGERAALAMRLARAARAGGQAAQPAITRRRADAPAPLSFAQQRLWFLSQMEADDATYNLPISYELTGRLDVPTLERSLNEIVRRHEALRTTFTILDGEPVQVVTPTLTLSLPFVDLSHLTGEEQWVELRRRANEYVRRPFDLERGPLVRATLLKLSDETHYLLVLMHHIVGDAWSMGIMMSELSTLYRAFLAGEPSPLAELPIQYADFAVWQRESLTADALQRQLDYWKRKLDGAPSVLQLPTDHPRPSIPTHRGSSKIMLLPEGLSRALKELSQREGVTLFMTLLAAFDVLLYRYTGQTDISIGTPLAGRSRPETEPLIGLFINPVVLRADLSGNPSFRRVLGRIREDMFEAHANQDVPFEKLVAELQPERTAAHTPLFQVMIILQNAPMEESAASADLVISLGNLDADIGAAKFDLTISLEETTDNRLLSHWDYKTDLFEHATITRMFKHLRTLLEAIVADPELRLSEITILDKDESQRLLVEWNNTSRAYPLEKCLHQFFEQQAAATPDRRALIFEVEQLTYRELNARANQLARHLRSLGVGADSLVGVLMERSVEMIVSLIAVLKAGAAYVPLDPSYPSERLSFMIEDAGAAVILTQQRLRNALPEGSGRIVCADDQTAFDAFGDDDLAPVAMPDNLAYVIYTSGSTGQPKGAMNTHRAITNRLLWMQEAYGLNADDRVLQKTSFSFDVSVWEFFWPLMVGSTLVVARPAGHKDSAYLVDLIREHKITTLHFVPSMLQVFLEDPRVAECESLRRVICSGEALPYELQQRFFTRSAAALHNLYGPTEAAVDVTSWACRHDATDTVVPIGRPIANIQTYVLDHQLQPVPVGVAGELHIGGAGLARGYLHRPALTAEKFIPDPFSSQPGARLYRTGDLARYLPGGEIEYLGRLDQQVKIRGFRIEPGEIEAALRTHPDVREAVVVTREESAGRKHLVAYTVQAGERVPEADALRSHLKSRLPAYMLPSVFVPLDALPLTPSGKVDRQRLPAPGGVRPELGRGYVAPRTELEQMLAEMWQNVLRVSEVGVHDNFFELGGDSIHAAIFINSLQKRFGVVVYVVALFDAPTVAALAAHLEERHASTLTARKELTPIRPQARVGGGQFPVSFAQQRLWFIDRLSLDSAFYNIPQALRLNGRLDVSSLERSLNEIIRRHEALRTSFTDSGGRPVQVVNDITTLSLPLADISRLTEGEREREAFRLAVEEGHRPFDLSIAPLIRASLLRLGEQEHILLVTTHHIVSDGWSAGIFLRELSALYGAFLRGEPSPLAELPVQYADFAVWQREWLHGEVLEEQLDYWKQRLGGELPVLKLPTDRPRPPALSYSGAEQSLELPAELTGRLKSLSRREGATLFITLLAAFDALLYRYTGQEDIVVGTPIAGRNRREVEGLIGFFVNTLVMRASVEGEATFRELLGRVREATLGAYAHQEVPFEKLVEELHPKRDMSRNPLFQVAFALQNAPTQELALRGLNMTTLDVGVGTSRFDLEVHIWEEEDEGLGGYIVYSTDLFEEASIARLHAHYLRLLAGIMAEPDTRISELPLLTEAERRQLLYEWNDTRVDYPRGSCIHELFEAQAARTPDAVALVCGEQRITYGELNRRADELAHRLRAAGVKPEVVVGLYAGRTVEMVSGLLGVLKAGGAYVPLDPDYPRERLAFILADTQAGVVLTEERLLGKMPPHEAEVICLDRVWTHAASESASQVTRRTDEANLAYVIYTSGSTGRPKGVGITHSGVVTLLRWARDNFSAGELEGVLAATSICFDLSAFEIFVPLSVGGKVILAENALALPALPAAGEVTLVNTVPSAMAELVRMSGVPRSVLCVNLAGEPLKNSLAQGVYAQGNVRRVLNLYGPSEDTTYSTVASHARGASHEPAIGRPIANTQIYVLDNRMRPVAVGVPGELYIGGEGLARGYLARPDLTAERFIPDLFGGMPGRRLYRTGDMARYLPGGDLEFLGRVDQQVKIRGFRIEPGEIEAVLSTHPAVRQSIVTTGKDATGELRLVAYVVGAETGASSGELKVFLRERLPQYMVPSVFVFLDALPLTPNGKVERQRLPAPDDARPEAEAAEYVAPRTPVEEALAAIWREVLGVQQVGVYDNFFDLGGHSLLATRVLSLVRERCGAEVPLRLMFESPTVEGIAAHVEAADRRQDELGRLTDVLDRLEQLSEEEVRALLERTAGDIIR